MNLLIIFCPPVGQSRRYYPETRAKRAPIPGTGSNRHDFPTGRAGRSLFAKALLLGGPRVRISFPPPASLFSPVPSRATDSEPRGLAAVCAWVETEKGTGRPRLVLLGPFSLSGFDAVPLRESYSGQPRAASVPRPGSGSSLAANLQVICAARSSRAADRVRSAAWR